MKWLPCLLASSIAWAQPAIQNAKLEKRAAASLAASLAALRDESSSPAWAGWAVPAIAGRGESCCWHSDNWGSSRGCWLEGNRQHGPFPAAEPARAVKLEGASVAHILVRFENRQVSKLRLFSSDCELDAGGARFVWLEGVPAADSVKYLSSFVTQSESTKDREQGSAVHAVGVHAGPEASSALERWLQDGAYSSRVRRDAAFWLSSSRGKPGFETVRQWFLRETDDRLRESALHGLTSSSEPAAIPFVFEAARKDRSPRVRGQAMFWLAQKAGRQAVPVIREAIDGDAAVRDKAVFAVSQLPKNEGVPILIELARSNKHPEVRKKAMFWLGQSKDPKALEFFEQVLSGAAK